MDRAKLLIAVKMILWMTVPLLADAPSQQAAVPSVAQLRAAGPAALDRLLARRDAMVAAAKRGESVDVDQLRRLETLIDQVAGQRYASHSRLFWFTDLDEAKSAAKRSGRPILSLRLLGKLTDEYTCANSRFFRTTLYSNPAIAKTMRERFVLHWKSVRPVPVVTIDFGDGRKLKRTLTGNSVHYVLAPDGTPLDALPGLYSPARFAQWLSLAENHFDRYRKVAPDRRAAVLRDYHRRRLSYLARAWFGRYGMALPTKSKELNAEFREELARRRTAQTSAQGKPPEAARAARVAVTKAVSELPLINALAMFTVLEDSTSRDVWEKLAERERHSIKYAPESLALIYSQRYGQRTVDGSAAPELIAATTYEGDVAFGKMLAKLKRATALDNLRNEYLLHRRIHRWLLDAEEVPDVESLNARVYDELFLTPKSDPWLGLLPGDAYTALPKDGVQPAKQ